MKKLTTICMCGATGLVLWLLGNETLREVGIPGSVTLFASDLYCTLVVVGFLLVLALLVETIARDGKPWREPRVEIKMPPKPTKIPKKQRPDQIRFNAVQAETILRFLRDHKEEIEPGSPLDVIQGSLLGFIVYGEGLRTDERVCGPCPHYHPVTDEDDAWCGLWDGETCPEGM